MKLTKISKKYYVEFQFSYFVPNDICSHHTHSISSKYTENAFSTGALFRTTLGELTALSRFPGWILGGDFAV